VYITHSVQAAKISPLCLGGIGGAGWGLGLRFGPITLMQIFPADVIAAVRGFITKRLHLTGTLAIAVLLLRRRVANYVPTNKNYE
jgi:hypothetical protein